MKAEVILVSLALGALGLAGRSASLPPAFLDPRLLSASVIEEGPFPKRMIDPAGRATVLPAPPRRVVSRALVADEFLLELLPPERISGLTYLIDDGSVSPGAGRVPASIRRTRGGLEEVLSLEPDLVVVAEYSEGGITAQLLGAGLPVLRLGSYSCFEDIFADLRRLGAALGEDGAARAAIRRIQGRIDAVRERVAGRPRPRLLFLSGGGYTAGAGTLTDECISLAGAHNEARALGIRGTAPLPVEQIVALAPEIVVLSSPGPHPRRAGPGDLPPGIPWEVIPAAINGRVFLVPAAWAGTVSHHAVRALEAFAELVHGIPGAVEEAP